MTRLGSEDAEGCTFLTGAQLRLGPVLVVDDDPADRLLLREMLETLGFSSADIMVEEDPGAGLSRALESPPRILICDWRLRCGPAKRFIRAMQATRPDLITVVISESLDAEQELVAVDVGAHEILAKSELSATALERAMLRAERRRERLDRDEKLASQIVAADRNAYMAAASRALVHDLDNLVLAVAADLDWVVTEVDRGSRMGQTLRSVRAAVKHMQELCGSVVEAVDQDHVRSRSILLVEGIARCIGLLPMVLRTRICLRTQVPVEQEVAVNETVFRQTIANLLANALEASATEVFIDVHRVNAASSLTGTCVVDATAGGALLAVEISNAGPPIPPELHGKIFQPFFTTKTGHRGLGLAAVKSSIREMGAALAVASDDAGTVFSLALPVDHLGPDLH